MPSWGKKDLANNSVKFGAALVRARPDTSNNELLYGNTTVGQFISGQKTGIFLVAPDEVTAQRAGKVAKPAHSGWVLRTEGSGGRAGRVTYETLVAIKATSGVDAADDVTIPDYAIIIDTQPASSNSNVNSAISFTVSARTVPAGGSLVYTWERAQGNGVFLPVASAGLFSGANSATLAISNNATLAANTFRVVVQNSDGAANVNSANATVSVY